MKFEVLLKPGSSRRAIIQASAGYEAWVHGRPNNNQANEELLELLSEFFGVSKSRIKILSPRSRIKIVEIE